MIAINVWYCVPLIKQKIDIQLDEVESKVYENCFKSGMDKHTCRTILKSASFFHLANNNFLVQQGNQYNGVYLLVYLNQDHQVSIIENDKTIGVKQDPLQWIGLVEYDMMRKANKDEIMSINWPISIRVEKRNNQEAENDNQFQDYTSSFNKSKYHQPLYVYFFKFEDLQKLYMSDNGIFIRNSLHSIWLDSLTNQIFQIDKMVGEIKFKHLPRNTTIERNITIKENNSHKQSIKPHEKIHGNSHHLDEEASSFSINLQDQAQLDKV